MSAMTTDLLTVSLSSNSPAYLLRNTMIEKDIEPSAWAELEDGEYVQAMTQSQWFRTNGLDIPADATEEDILIAMRASRTLHQSDSWVRGDLIEWMRNNKFGGGEIPKRRCSPSHKNWACAPTSGCSTMPPPLLHGRSTTATRHTCLPIRITKS